MSSDAIIAALELLLKGAGIAMRVDEFVAQYLERKSAGATDDELHLWARNLLDTNIHQAQTAIDKMPDDPS